MQQRAIGATREQMLRELAEAVETLTAEHPLILVAAGTVLRGWALAEQGELATGLAQIQRGMHAYRETGTALGWSNYLVHLAEVFAGGGKRAAGLQTLEEAQNIVAHGQERYWKAELYRVKADLLVAHGSSRQTNEEVETALHHALAVARQQQAKVLELRVSMRLSRLWQQQGKLEEARQLLAPIYAWFSEGFDTVDLQEANALLRNLN